MKQPITWNFQHKFKEARRSTVTACSSIINSLADSNPNCMYFTIERYNRAEKKMKTATTQKERNSIMKSISNHLVELHS